MKSKQEKEEDKDEIQIGKLIKKEAEDIAAAYYSSSGGWDRFLKQNSTSWSSWKIAQSTFCKNPVTKYTYMLPLNYNGCFITRYINSTSSFFSFTFQIIK